MKKELLSEQQKPLLSGKNITISDIRQKAVVQSVAGVHAEAFTGYLNTRFGMGYITSYINWFAHANQTIALAAFDDQQHITGYAVGVLAGHPLNRELFWVLVRSVILRPWLLCDVRLWQAARSRLRFLVDGKKACDRLDLPKPTMALVAIGVSSSYRRQGIAVHLMQAFEEKARSLKMRSLIAWVYEDNTLARQLYEKCGWQPCTDSLDERRSLKYFKVIDG
jgi:GNAT superfamily N-acetyltransferase